MNRTDNQKESLLNAALRHVPFEGWSESLLQRAGKDAGIEPEAMKRLFPGNIQDLLEYWMESAEIPMWEAANLPGSFRERMESAIWAGWMHLARRREAMQSAASWYALHPLTAARHLSKSVDSVWRAMGDHPSDFSFYTKRATLAAILSALMIYWMQDESDGWQDTRTFLRARLADTKHLGKLRAWMSGLRPSGI